MNVTSHDHDRKAAATAKRARKAALRVLDPIHVLIPTNRPGPEFARAEIRRMDRRQRKKAKASRPTSARAAALRMRAKHQGARS